MPRRKAREAQAVAARQAVARMHYVIRNPRFRKELDRVQDDEAVSALSERWGLFRLPVISRDTHVAKLLEGRDARTILADVPSYIPRIELLKAHLFKALEARGAGREPQYRETLELKVDLSYPQDVLEEIIKKEVRNAKAERLMFESNLQERVHLDKTEFQLKVFDLAFDNRTFKEIAASLHRSVSTVKSALLSVKRKITSIRPVGEAPPDSSQVIPTKKELSLSGFNPDEHCAQCPICKKASTEDYMCEQAKLYLNEGYRSGRELLWDSVEIGERPAISTANEAAEYE